MKFAEHEYGYWHYGDCARGPPPKLWRNNEYDTSYSLLMHFLRTGAFAHDAAR